jgi:hypothetical protein
MRALRRRAGEREQRITPGIGQGCTHLVPCRRITDGADRLVRRYPFPGRVGEHGRQPNQSSLLVHSRVSSGRCWMLQAMDCARSPKFDWNSCPGWPTLHSGPRPACPAGDFLHAYKANRRSAIEDMVEADPVAARTRDIMAARVMWSGNATDLLRVAAPNPRDEASWTGVGWPKSPRALAGRLRRAQTPLRALGIEITFGREGRGGTRIIRMRKSCPEATAATVTTVSTDSAQKAVD